MLVLWLPTVCNATKKPKKPRKTSNQCALINQCDLLVTYCQETDTQGHEQMASHFLN